MPSARADRSKKPYSRPAPRPRGGDGEWLHDRAPGSSVPALGGTNGATGAPLNTKLIVSNLHYEVTPKELIQIFGQIGTLVREPLIRYDRSGRSSGVAIISFETPAQATRAKKQFEGILAKGQPMSIAYDTAAPRGPRRTAGTTSLLNRIQKPPLLDRLSQTEPRSQPAVSGKRGVGPVRTKAPRAPRAPKKPKTAEELDSELDSFMKDDSSVGVVAAATVAVEEDVEMA